MLPVGAELSLVVDARAGAAPPTPAGGLRLYLRLLSYVKPHAAMFTLAIAGMILTALTEPIMPWLMKEFFDHGFGEQRTIAAWMVPATLLGLFALRGVFTFTTGYAMSWVENRVLADLRQQMFARLVELPAAVYDRESGGALISRLTYDVNNVTGAATHVLTTMVRDSFVVLGLLGWLLILNWRLTLIALTLIPLVGMVVYSFTRRMRRLNRDSLTVMGQMTHVIEEAIGSQRVVKLFGGAGYERDRFRAATERIRSFARRLQIASGLVVPITQLLAASAVSAVVVLAMQQTHSSSSSVGGFVSFITAMLMLLAPLKHLADLNNPLQRGLAAAEAVFGFIDQPIEADTGTRQIDRARGELVFERVTIRYPGADKDALTDLSLTIPAGQTIALVGTSGGGKTTIANLIPRFYLPNGGRILIDGVPIDELTLASLRRQIAMVSQDVMLFNDTIANNIAYGDARGASREQIRHAAKVAYLEEMIDALPAGFDTEIGDNGVRLSGGQRQRLAIARAVLKNAPILILDEATSALDNESERYVQAALDQLRRGRTTLVIAHRLSTIESADRIVVVVNGKIVEQGTSGDLIKANGVYARLQSTGEFTQ